MGMWVFLRKCGSLRESGSLRECGSCSRWFKIACALGSQPGLLCRAVPCRAGSRRCVGAPRVGFSARVPLPGGSIWRQPRLGRARSSSWARGKPAALHGSGINPQLGKGLTSTNRDSFAPGTGVRVLFNSRSWWSESSSRQSCCTLHPVNNLTVFSLYLGMEHLS